VYAVISEGHAMTTLCHVFLLLLRK